MAERMDYTVGLTWTTAGFGGRRWWFLLPDLGPALLRSSTCPGCVAGSAAPRAHGLAYGVTRMAEQDRLWHRMAKIARRLGDDDPDQEIPPDRPKWMRITTYGRLIDSWHNTAERRDDLCFTMAAGSLARFSGRPPIWPAFPG